MHAAFPLRQEKDEPRRTRPLLDRLEEGLRMVETWFGGVW